MSKLLPQLDQIEWHDTPIHSLQVDFSQRQFVLVLNCYDEGLAYYVRREAVFQEIDTLEWSGAAEHDVDVYSLDISQIGVLYQAHFMLLTIHNGPSATISFRFKDVIINPRPT